MKIFAWILQVLLALAFFFHGCIYIVWPDSFVEMARQQNPNSAGLALSAALRMFIGIAEILGAVGLIVPGLARIKPILTSWAAGGLALTMLAAIIFHLMHNESMNVPGPAVLFVLSACIAYLRWKVVPFSVRLEK
jgi:uncharacterized membrane protein